MTDDTHSPSRTTARLGSLALFVGSLLVFFLLLEAGVRIAYPLFANYNLEMWRYFREMKQRLPDDDPMSFYHFPDTSGDYYGAHVEINAYGLRDDPITRERKPGTRRVILLGDSFVFGWGVAFDDMIGQQLERMLNADPDYAPCEVINLGVGNYNSMMQAALLENYGMPLEPDLVVLNYFVNDVEPTPRLGPIEYHFKRSSYAYAVLFDQFVSLKGVLDQGFQWDAYYASLYSEGNPALERNAEALRQMASLCQAAGIPLLICSYPELRQLKDYPFPMATEFIQNAAQEAGAPFVDLLPHFAPHEPNTLWVSAEDSHGNAEASRIAAEAMYGGIQEAFGDFPIGTE